MGFQLEYILDEYLICIKISISYTGLQKYSNALTITARNGFSNVLRVLQILYLNVSFYYIKNNFHNIILIAMESEP